MRLHLLPPPGAAEPEPIAAEKVIAGSPVTRSWVQYEQPGGKLAAGLWEAGIGKWRIAYTEWEYVVMISGRCLLKGDDGAEIHAGPGDAFVIEPGFVGTWEVLEPMRKHWVIEDKT